MAKKLLVLAHPDIEASKVNKRLLEGIKDEADITLHELYKEYPDFKIDANKEQGLLVAHDEVVFQFPFYWYSCPALLKEWMDKVLQYGFAFGAEGTALQGKKFSVVTTTGSPAEAYSPEGRNRYEVADFLKPFAQMASLTGMEYVEPLVVHGALSITEEGLRESVAAYKEHLASLSR